MNDYDTIAQHLDKIQKEFVGNMHATTPDMDKTDSITLTKEAALNTAINIQRLQDWVQGLAETHRNYKE